MKLAITTKSNLEDTIFELSFEIIDKYKGLNACAKLENLDLDLSDLKQDGNALVYVSTLNMEGKVDIESLIRYKRVIFVALGAKYHTLLKKIFDEFDESIDATKLFDLADCYIIGDKASTKTLDNDKEEM